MKTISLLLALFLATLSVSAQKKTQKNVVNEFAAVDKIALQLPDSLTNSTDNIAKYISTNFTTEKDKSRAAFIWVASNIQYDIENMFALNFYEKKEDKIIKALKNRKGICESYAHLFTDICKKSGMKSVVVEGYTQQDGFADFIPHAWCATRIDSTWLLFDPTWGSGYVSDSQFYKKINNSYHRADPAKLIESHMPFDYLWQFLNYPVTTQEFYMGNTKINPNKEFFNFNDSILVFEKLDRIQQLTAESRRIEKNGVKNAMIFDRFQHIKMEIENYRRTHEVDLYNGAVADYNDGVKGFNQFIDYRNKQFSPKVTDPEIQQMLDRPDASIKEAKLKLNQIEPTDPNLARLIVQLDESIAEISTQLKQQQDWLRLYFNKSKAGRKSMFYKFTWFGKPMN